MSDAAYAKDATFLVGGSGHNQREVPFIVHTPAHEQATWPSCAGTSSMSRAVLDAWTRRPWPPTWPCSKLWLRPWPVQDRISWCLCVNRSKGCLATLHRDIINEPHCPGCMDSAPQATHLCWLKTMADTRASAAPLPTACRLCVNTTEGCLATFAQGHHQRATLSWVHGFRLPGHPPGLAEDHGRHDGQCCTKSAGISGH